MGLLLLGGLSLGCVVTPDSSDSPPYDNTWQAGSLAQEEAPPGPPLCGPSSSLPSQLNKVRRGSWLFGQGSSKNRMAVGKSCPYRTGLGAGR